MQNFLEIVKNYIVAIGWIIFAGLILYGTIVIGLIVLTAGLVIGLIAWAVFYWKFRHTIHDYQKQQQQQQMQTGEDLHYYEAVNYEEIKKNPKP